MNEDFYEAYTPESLDVDAHADDEVRHEEFIERIQAYNDDDPKHPSFHERMAEVWDARCCK